MGSVLFMTAIESLSENLAIQWWGEIGKAGKEMASWVVARGTQ